MKINIHIFVVLVAAAIAGSAFAQTSDLNSLSWMAGTWEGVDGRMQMEEHWTAPRGDSMLGVHRDVAGGRTVSFEFLRIEKRQNGIVYVAQPQGNPPTEFRLIESSQNRVVFENKTHDFPQRIIYWTEPGAANVLNARVEGIQNGRSSSMQWSWKKAGSVR